MSDKTVILFEQDKTTVKTGDGQDSTSINITSESTTSTDNDVQTVVFMRESTTVVGSSEAGAQGIQGVAGIYVGPTPPSDLSVIWVDTS